MRISGYGLGEVACQLEHVGVLGDAFLAVVFSHTVHVADEIQILDPAHECIKIRIVRYIGHDLFAGDRIIFYGVSVYSDLSGVEGKYAHARLKRGGFAGAVVANKAVDLAGGDVQGQVVDGGFFPVTLRQMTDIEHDTCASL